MRHKAVRVSQNIVVEPWTGAFSRMTSLSSCSRLVGVKGSRRQNSFPDAQLRSCSHGIKMPSLNLV